MRRIEQQVEHGFAIAHEHGVERVWNGENHMKILARNEFAHAGIDPFLLPRTAAVGAMLIPA